MADHGTKFVDAPGRLSSGLFKQARNIVIILQGMLELRNVRCIILAVLYQICNSSTISEILRSDIDTLHNPALFCSSKYIFALYKHVLSPVPSRLQERSYNV